MKKVTLLINSLGGGGAEGVCVSLANKLNERGWHVTLAVLHLNNAVHHTEVGSGIEIVVLGKNHARTALFSLRRFLSHRKPERILVFNHQLAVLLVMLRTVSAFDFRIVARNINTLSANKAAETSFWHKHIVQALTKLLYGKVDAIVSQSKGMAKDLEVFYAVSPERITTIYNPISSKIESLPVQMDSSSPRDYLLCVGRLEIQKAFHYAITSFAALVNHHPDLRLKIVGTGSLEGELKKQAAMLDVADRVDFEGFQADIISYYLGAKATVLTSLYEGFPNVLIESIFLGTPVVAFDCPSGPSEIIEQGVNGILVQHRDETGLIEAIRKVLNEDWPIEQVSSTADAFRSDRIIAEYERVLG